VQGEQQGLTAGNAKVRKASGGTREGNFFKRKTAQDFAGWVGTCLGEKKGDHLAMGRNSMGQNAVDPGGKDWRRRAEIPEMSGEVRERVSALVRQLLAMGGRREGTFSEIQRGQIRGGTGKTSR